MNRIVSPHTIILLDNMLIKQLLRNLINPTLHSLHKHHIEAYDTY